MADDKIDDKRIDKTLGDTVPRLLQTQRAKYPDCTLQAVKNEHGRWDRYSYTYVYERVIELAVALDTLGVKKGDKCGILADNRREWLVTDLALLSLGAIDVPRGCDSTGVEMRFILDFTGCTLCFFENERQLSKILEGDTSLKSAVLYDPVSIEVENRAKDKGITCYNYWELEARGKHSTKKERDEIEKRIASGDKSDTATIIFTSGTTGTPKGVMLSHDSFIAQAQVVAQVLVDARPGDIWLSVLPIWHSFERAFCYLTMALGSGIAYSKPVAGRILDDLATLKPQWISAVPRLWEALERGIKSQVRKKSAFKSFIFDISLFIGTLYSRAYDKLRLRVCHFRYYPHFIDCLTGVIPWLLLFLPHLITDALVFRRVREVFGGKMVAGISGGGALSPSIDRFFHAIGFNLLEGYGMTETAPVISLRNSHRPRLSCVGEVVPSMKVKIVAYDPQTLKPINGDPLPPGRRGLIMASGRQVMQGYYKRDDLTKQILGEDGYLNTGDIGMISYDNDLKITGRAKDTIVLQGGENVEPENIEKAITQSPYINYAVVLGQDQRSIGALIVPDRESILSYALENHIVYVSYETLLDSNEVKTLIRQEIDSLVQSKTGFRPCERVSSFVILKSTFKVGTELSAKGSLCRPVITHLYAKKIKRLFAS